MNTTNETKQQKRIREMKAIRESHKNCTGNGQRFNYTTAVAHDRKQSDRWDEERDY